MVACAAVCITACATYHPPRDLVYARTSVASGGHRIAVERFAPTGAPGPGAFSGPPPARRPGALVLHTSAGIGATTGAETRRWAEALARHGVVAYVVHYFDRTGNRHTDDPTEARLWPVWTTTVADALAALRHDPEVDSTRAGVVGLSLGGYLALALGAGVPEAAAPRPSALVVVSGGFYRPVAARVDSLGRGAAFPPTLLLHGTADGAVPFDQAERVDRALGQAGAVHALVAFAGEDHLLAPGSRPGARDTAARFLADPRGFVRAASAAPAGVIPAAGTPAAGTHGAGTPP